MKVENKIYTAGYNGLRSSGLIKVLELQDSINLIPGFQTNPLFKKNKKAGIVSLAKFPPYCAGIIFYIVYISPKMQFLLLGDKIYNAQLVFRALRIITIPDIHIFAALNYA